MIMRRHTNGREKAKLYITYLDPLKTSVLISKRVLSAYDYSNIAEPLKSYKGKTLWEQKLSIKISTLQDILLAI